MAVVFAQYNLPAEEVQLSRPPLARFLDAILATPQHARDRIDWSGLLAMEFEQSSSAIEVPPTSDVPEPAVTPLDDADDTLNRDLKFEIAYHALADRRGANATPAGRTVSRKVWRAVLAGP